MEYTITRTKRNAIIFCSSFLILYLLATRLLFLIAPPVKIHIAERLILNVMYLIPFGYLMLVFFKYFRHYKLKILQISIFIIFILELSFKSTLLTYTVGSIWSMFFFLSVSTLWMAATIVMIANLLRNKTRALPGVISLRNYAISSLLIYAFVTTYPFYLKPFHHLETQQIIGLISAFPYIFTIVFAMNLKSADNTSS